MKPIVEQVRGYNNSSDRNRAIKMLAKRGWNHFICYKDVCSDIALMFGKADWVKPGQIYVDR